MISVLFISYSKDIDIKTLSVKVDVFNKVSLDIKTFKADKVQIVVFKDSSKKVEISDCKFTKFTDTWVSGLLSKNDVFYFLVTKADSISYIAIDTDGALGWFLTEKEIVKWINLK